MYDTLMSSSLTNLLQRAGFFSPFPNSLLSAYRSGNEEKLMALLTPLNVNCHASDGRKVSEIPILYFHFLRKSNLTIVRSLGV